MTSVATFAIVAAVEHTKSTRSGSTVAVTGQVFLGDAYYGRLAMEDLVAGDRFRAEHGTTEFEVVTACGDDPRGWLVAQQAGLHPLCLVNVNTRHMFEADRFFVPGDATVLYRIPKPCRVPGHRLVDILRAAGHLIRTDGRVYCLNPVQGGPTLVPANRLVDIDYAIFHELIDPDTWNLTDYGRELLDRVGELYPARPWFENPTMPWG